MLGRELLVHPVLDEGVETVDAYFPADIWYNYYTGDAIVSDTGILKTLSAKMTEPINIHVRGGSVVP